MPNWRPELVSASRQLKDALLRTFEPSVVRIDTPDDAPIPTLLLTFKNELAAFAITDGDARENYRRSYAYFRKVYDKNPGALDALNLSFVLCLLTERRDAE